jgi:hypothetical protein
MGVPAPHRHPTSSRAPRLKEAHYRGLPFPAATLGLRPPATQQNRNRQIARFARDQRAPDRAALGPLTAGCLES